jgi:hypothetical protein
LYKVDNPTNTDEYYYIATNQALKNVEKNKNLNLLSKDIFWNPVRCAQMKSFYTKDKIFLVDSLFANPEDNNGSEFVDLLYVYDVEKNILSSYKLNQHLNILDFDKKDFKAENGNILIYFRNEQNMLNQAKLDLKTFEFAEIKKVEDQNKSIEIVESNETLFPKVKHIRPFYIKIFGGENFQNPLFELTDVDRVTFYLLGS